MAYGLFVTYTAYPRTVHLVTYAPNAGGLDLPLAEFDTLDCNYTLRQAGFFPEPSYSTTSTQCLSHHWQKLEGRAVCSTFQCGIFWVILILIIEQLEISEANVNSFLMQNR